LEIKCILSEKPLKKIAHKEAEAIKKNDAEPDELATISNIFGSAEMLE
jgi:hypothetical protein